MTPEEIMLSGCPYMSSKAHVLRDSIDKPFVK